MITILINTTAVFPTNLIATEYYEKINIKMLTKLKNIVNSYITSFCSAQTVFSDLRTKSFSTELKDLTISFRIIKGIILFSSLYYILAWLKSRVGYYVHNWVYTTNHKRIAVNYFWFVIFSGICGTTLAVIIRLEMAYPGVGILAGDSLQYLSIVTAHAVIMVFFMIMPLLFGAFGNFLLPTQLGVHDVAFPRLNSVAFWFLPGGLIMLAQLICLDRRYQRMNCFNIREIQTLLKSRFYPDLIGESNFRLFLPKTAIGMRYKLQDLNFLNPNFLLLNKFSLSSSFNPRIQSYNTESYPLFKNFPSTLGFPNFFNLFFFPWLSKNSKYNLYSNFSLFQFSIPKETIFLSQTFVLQNIYTQVYNVLESLSFLFFSFGNSAVPFWTKLYSSFFISKYFLYNSKYSILQFYYLTKQQILFDFTFTPHLKNFKLFDTQGIFFPSKFFSFLLFTVFKGFKTFFSFQFQAFIKFFSNEVFFLNIPFYLFLPTSLFSNLFFTPTFTSKNFSKNQKIEFATNIFFDENLHNQALFGFQEQTLHYRNQRLQNPIFRYDFKLGNYMSDDAKTRAPYLFTSIHDLTTGVRKPTWFVSSDFVKILYNDVSLYFNYFNTFNKKSAYSKLFQKHLLASDNTINLSNPFFGVLSHSAAFYNYFHLLSEESKFLNHRWLSVNTLTQKFQKMFLTNSMQQRIHGNWRQLKFTREAWRCKLLASRHQNTMHKRYLNEDSTVWSVERNAKDLLPGWAMITPFSARTRFTAVGKVDVGLFGVFLVINASIVSASNFLITYRYLATLNNRKMRDARSFFTEGVMVASWMIIAANPMLSIAILMLLSDRHWQTSFFDYSGGGDTVMFQHMFWFFGHPEVYIILIPTFGFNNTIFSFYLRKRVSARASLLYSMYTIAFLGFFVWGHHMYMVGLAHTTRMLFSTLTVMISIPAATKLMHWSVTLVNSSFAVELPFVFQLFFVFSFVSGGISGMGLAHTGLDILFHDSFYVVGHFHVMLAGAGMYGSWGAFYFYFPAIWGVKFSRIWGYLHCLYYVIGQFMIVIPMIWLGYSGMPRRVLDYPASMGGWHAITSAGTLLSVGGIMAFFIMLFDSLRQGRAATRNTFGISRFNTRLNFYLYVGSRSLFLQRKSWYLSRFNYHYSVHLNKLNYNNYEDLELTLLSYSFISKASKKVLN